MPAQTKGDGRLQTLGRFGSNPGNLSARYYLPEGLRPGSPLVVVLHGCTQNASGYDRGAGWSRLADEYGFALLFPEQKQANNPNLCFNWFSVDDASRGRGEALSIRQMVAAVQSAHGTDPDRLFVTGLSAGGAMTAVMLATYPDLFAGGAVIAGLPYGVAHSVPEAFDRMRGHGLPDAASLEALVRGASGHAGPWPTLSVWHGSADATVSPANGTALVEQWLALQGAPPAPVKVERVQGHSRRVWADRSGRELVEEYVIGGMGHGTPLSTRNADSGEVAGAFMLEAGISSTRLIANFWKLDRSQPSAARPPAAAATPAPRPRVVHSTAEQGPPAAAGGNAIAKTIEDALRSAGLMR